MKRILVAIFAIWTFAMFGQNVNPETFPTVSGSIQDKNLYTNTSGEGKISIKTIWDSVKITDTVSTTYADFYTLITGGNLQVGKTYILIDFQTIYDQMDFDASGNLKSSLTTKTGAIEQIWVLALAPDRIASTAYSKTYPNDRIQYDWTYNTTLVNGSPAKGRISERIDEWNNRTDYDHRVIKFIRYDDGSGNYVQIKDSGRTAKEYLTFGDNYGSGGTIYDNWLGDFYSIGMFFGQEYGNNVFNSNIIISNYTSSQFNNNTIVNNAIFNYMYGTLFGNTFNNGLINNSMTGYIHDNKFEKVQNCILSGNIISNTLKGDFKYNNISGGFNNNIAYGDFINNIITLECYNNVFNGSVIYSSITSLMFNNTFNNSISSSVFNGQISSCSISSEIQKFICNSDFVNNTITGNHQFLNVCTNGFIGNKTIDELTYPFLFGTYYKKEIFMASNGNIYARYFDGTNDINTLIP